MPSRIVIDTRHIRDFGIGTYIRNLVHALAKLDSDNRYLLVAYSADAQEWRGLPSNFELALYERKDSDLFDQAAFPLFLRGLRADLYHIPLNVVSLLMPTPYVVTVHDMSSLLYDQMPTRRRRLPPVPVPAGPGAGRQDHRGIERHPARHRRAVRHQRRQDPADLQCAGSSVSRSRPGSQRPRTAAHTLERYQIRRPFLLYVGTIRPQKNIPRLVEAFAVLRAELEGHPTYGDLRLIIIGDEISRHPEVRRTVIQTRVEQAVRFLGFVPFDTLRTFYASAAAFVFPSLYEGFGLPPLEAMASGTPVVTSNVSSLPEVVGDSAVLVNPENVFEIARGIREALTNESLREALIHRGHQQARKFSWEATARQVLDVYQEFAGVKALS